MAEEAADMQMADTQCQKPLDIAESLLVQEDGDWRQPYLNFLLHLIYCHQIILIH